MSLTPKTKLGPYEILAHIGAGGMGEVYRARDTRLDRTVAIKILPSALSSNSNLKQRFEREAKMISNLSHPHICTLHDVGHENGIDYLVMEYLEGQTLADRLSRGPLSINEVLRYAVQICDALDKAHRQGIVHRDLKPGNIMLTKHGVKLLDFGLAKWTAAESPIEVAATAELTLKQSLTEVGTILGTVQYMAPEQLEGKEADARTDIFAFGAVLYEMVSGTKAFSGKSRASIMAAILEREPERLSQLAPLIPPALDRVIAGCLAKDPEERWQTAHDLKLQLKWILEGGSEMGTPKPVAVRRLQRELVAWCLGGILTAWALYAGWQSAQQSSNDLRVVRFDLAPPAGGAVGSLAVSPDGRRIVMSVGRRSTMLTERGGQLWIYSTDSGRTELIPNCERATEPFWSPDGKSIGFFADGWLKKVNLDSGIVVSLCESKMAHGGSWGSKDTIVFAPFARGPFYRVNAAEGPATAFTELKDLEARGIRSVSFLPDGEHFLFWSRDETHGQGIFVSSLNTPNRAEFIISATGNGIYSCGHLLYVNQGTLMAIPFDPDSRKLTGASVAVAESVRSRSGFPGSSLFSASAQGTIAYYESPGIQPSELIWFDLDGTKLKTLGTRETYHTARISPDGRWVAVTKIDPATKNRNLWIYDADRNAPIRLTNHEGNDYAPIWSPDGKSIVFASSRRGSWANLWLKEVGSLHPETLLLDSTESKFPTSWSLDGKRLIFFRYSPTTTLDLMTLAMDADSPGAEVFLDSVHWERDGRFSPDGKWVAYQSDELGPSQIFAISFPEKRGQTPISTSGGQHPVWSPDGTKLYYMDPEDFIVEVETNFEGSQLIPCTPKRLLQIESGSIESFDIAPDGQRFLVNVTADPTNAASVKVVLNWPLELQKK